MYVSTHVPILEKHKAVAADRTVVVGSVERERPCGVTPTHLSLCVLGEGEQRKVGGIRGGNFTMDACRIPTNTP